MSSITYNTYNMSPEEYQARLTNIAHLTIQYLENQGHITKEESEELQQTLVVVPIANNKLFGRLREWIFGKDSKEDKQFSHFVVTQLL